MVLSAAAAAAAAIAAAATAHGSLCQVKRSLDKIYFLDEDAENWWGNAQYHGACVRKLLIVAGLTICHSYC
jgi:hypothetical protein